VNLAEDEKKQKTRINELEVKNNFLTREKTLFEKKKIAELGVKVDQMEEATKRLTEDNTRLAKDNVILAKDNDRLAKDNDRLAKDNEKLVKNNTDISQKNESKFAEALKKRTEKETKEIERLKKELIAFQNMGKKEACEELLATSKQDIKELEDKVQNLETQLAELGNKFDDHMDKLEILSDKNIENRDNYATMLQEFIDDSPDADIDDYVTKLNTFVFTFHKNVNDTIYTMTNGEITGSDKDLTELIKAVDMKIQSKRFDRDVLANNNLIEAQEFIGKVSTKFTIYHNNFGNQQTLLKIYHLRNAALLDKYLENVLCSPN